jgi:hypothetical protein
LSNAALRAERDRLQAELNRIENENRRLQAEVDRTVSQLDNIHSGLDRYQNDVKNALVQSNNKMNSSASVADSAYGLQQQIESLYPLYKNMEEADKRIRELNNKKYYDFKNYRTVRKIMQGLMDNLDFNLINDEIIYKAIEKEHLQTPDFWLTSSLISIMSWINDTKDHANRALEDAYRMSPKDCCVFYMIMNLRLGREDAALKWLSLYEQQDLKRSDYETFLLMFSLISKTVYENVGTSVRTRVENFVTRIINESMQKEGYSEQQIISQIAEYLRVLRTRGSYNYPAIQQYSSDYGNLVELLDSAANNYNILERIKQIMNARIEERNAFLKEYIDKLLEKPNDVEKDTYNEIAYNEKIILYKGDIAAAKSEYDREMSYETEDINLIYEMMNWIHSPEKDNVNGQMRRNMFGIMKGFEQSGYQYYRSGYMSLVRDVFHIKVNDYETNANLRSPDSEYSKVRSYYNNVLSGQLAGIKDLMSYIFFAIAGVLLVGGIILGGPLIGLGIFGAVALAATGVGKILVNKNKRVNLVKQSESNIKSVNNIIGKMSDEYRKAMELFSSYDVVSDEIIDEFSKI